MRAKFVNEAHLRDIDPKDVITKEFFNKIDKDVYVYAYRLEELDDDESLSDDEIMSSQPFKDWIEYEIAHTLITIYDKLSDNINSDGTITIWRRMMVNASWLQNLKPGNRIGIYWSFDRRAAEPHWGYNDDKKDIMVLLEASIKEEHIDWLQSLRANVYPYEEEKEITLFKNTPIILKYIELLDSKINVEYLKNKTYRA